MATDMNVLVLDEDMMHRFARSCGFIHAIQKHTHANVTSTNVIADTFANIFGVSAVEVDQNWVLIRKQAKTYTEEYSAGLFDALRSGPKSFATYAGALDTQKQKDIIKIEAEFAKATIRNEGFAAVMKTCHQTALAVKYTSMFSLALISGVGGAAGAISFIQGLVFGVGYKMAYNTSKAWAQDMAVSAIVVNTAEGAVKDTRDAGLVQPGVEGLFKTVTQVCTGILKPNDQSAKFASDRIARQQELWLRAIKRGSEESAKKAERRVEAAVAQKIAAQGADKGVRVMGNLANGMSKALPVVWMGKDFWDIGVELKEDMKSL